MLCSTIQSKLDEYIALLSDVEDIIANPHNIKTIKKIDHRVVPIMCKEQRCKCST